MELWGIAIATLVTTLWLVVRILVSKNKQNSIPSVPGIPVLGNAMALGKGGLAFITQCRQEFGDVFCLQLLGQRMVFVFDPAMLTLFFKAPESSISFKPAVEQFTQRIYGLPSSEFFSRHEDLLATLRQLLVPAQLQDMGHRLLQFAQPQIEAWQQQGKVELWSACQSLVFGAAGQVLFGPAFFKRHGLQTVQQAFLEFEGNFEVAASPIPHLLLPQFRRSRRALLRMLSASLAAGDFRATVVEQLLQGCGLPEWLWPNLLLAVLWASQANSMPAMFWSLALLLMPEHAEARSKVLQELQVTVDSIRQQQPAQPRQCQQLQPEQKPVPGQRSQLEQLDDATVCAMLQLSLDKRSWVSRCVAEAIRLRLHSIAVRFVSDDHLMLTQQASAKSSSRSSSNGTTPQGSTKGSKQPSNGKSPDLSSCGLHVPRGSILCICPMESHHDPQLYPEEPWAFKPDREPIQGLAAGTVVPGVAGMGFGGGFWRCPGRFFAEMELALMLQLVLLRLELTPLPHQQQQQQQATTGVHVSQESQQVAKQPGSSLFSAVAAVLPAYVQQRLIDMAVFGLGVCGGSSRQQQQWQSSGVAKQAVAAEHGDVNGLGSVRLPRCELRRLVGFKVPAEPWWVDVQVRGS